MPTAVLEPLVTYWEATHDPEALDFAKAVAEGLLADSELLPPEPARILPTGEFHGHMHATLHEAWGVAHLGVDLQDPRLISWSKNIYDYAAQFGPGTGWMQAALWDNPVRELSETCAIADMASLASLIARGGFPEGRIDVQVHKQADYLLRPPAWSPRDQVLVLRNGKPIEVKWSGPALAYLAVPNVKPGEVLTLLYPLVEFQQVWGNWPTKPGLKLTIQWRGNSVITMSPAAPALPIDFASLPNIPPLPASK